jgi:hypothetical protein
MSELERPMKSNRLGLTVIPGLAIGSEPPQRIALSLVHPRERIDIPVGAIRRIEAREEFTLWEKGKLWMFRSPRVEVSVIQAIRDQIRRLTKDIVDEPMEIVVAGECVARPIVREPLGSQECFQISASDLAEAHALAHRLRAKWSKAHLRVIS